MDASNHAEAGLEEIFAGCGDAQQFENDRKEKWIGKLMEYFNPATLLQARQHVFGDRANAGAKVFHMLRGEGLNQNGTLVCMCGWVCL